MSESMFELILNQETIMLNETAVYDCFASQQTEWTFELKNEKLRVCAANKMHAKKTSENHQVFNIDKTQSKLISVADLKKTFVTVKIISWWAKLMWFSRARNIVNDCAALFESQMLLRSFI